MESGQALFEASQWLLALQLFWWPFVRIMAALSIAPLYAQRSLPVRARLLLAIVLTVALLPTLPPARGSIVRCPPAPWPPPGRISSGWWWARWLHRPLPWSGISGGVFSTRRGWGWACYT